MTQHDHDVQRVPLDAHVPPPVPTPRGHAGPGRTRTAVAALAGALVLMLGSGAAGGWAATRLDDHSVNTPTATQSVSHVDQASFARDAKTVEPSVVSINTGTAEGSGVVFDADGHILTNNHVVDTAQGDTVTVVANDGTYRQATIVGTDSRSDLAVIKVDGASHLKPATLGDSHAVKVGDAVLAFGSPLGLQGTVTSGIVSAKNRTIHESDQQGPAGGPVAAISGLLQTDAAINPGNSGGALVNTSGEVVGINTAIATAGGGNGNIGVGFAIPSDTAKHVAKQLINGGQVSHPYLGVGVAEANGAGALIRTVGSHSPAAQAGLQPGDLITKVGDHVIHTADDLAAAIQSASVGQNTGITYTRDGAQHTATVTLGEAP